MPEPFKNVFNAKAVTEMANFLNSGPPGFDSSQFLRLACEGLEHLEMKERSMQIVCALAKSLPEDFEAASTILISGLSSKLDAAGLGNKSEVDRAKDGIEGWLVAPIAEYVGIFGQSHFDTSMRVLKECTMRFSSEFGIRYFLRDQPDDTLKQLHTWTRDPNHHVRRLASEGCRPRLPWGMRLQLFVDDPHPILPILNVLKDDESEYVRRSVSNNLNDIAKDHPSIVKTLVNSWFENASDERKKLIRHACRTLLKQGDTETLALFNFHCPQIDNIRLILEPNQVFIGEEIRIKLEVEFSCTQSIMLDYAVYHKLANGSLSRKVFKWKQFTVNKVKSISLQKSHSFKRITTRNYYPGLHKIEILINGQAVACDSFLLS